MKRLMVIEVPEGVDIGPFGFKTVAPGVQVVELTAEEVLVAVLPLCDMEKVRNFVAAVTGTESPAAGG